MSRSASRWAFWGGLLLVASLPLAARALRGPPGARCAADGVRVEGEPAVLVVPGGRDPLPFCCVGCADRWLRSAEAAPGQVLVRDETTGRMVDAREAWFVRSRVLAQPATEDRVHAFGTLREARLHADAYRGRILTGGQRPFPDTP